jgi:RNA polymerase sigma factor (sigma-70 family)
VLTSSSPESDFASFFHTYRPRLVAAMIGFTGDRHLAEDATQETMLIIRRTWGQYDRPEHLMYTIGRQQAARLMRQHRKAIPLQSQSWDNTIPSDRLTTATAPDPGRDLDLEDALRRLPERQRQVVVLYFQQDLQIGEIAEILGIAPSAVKTHKARGLARLNDLLGAGTEATPAPIRQPIAGGTA